MGKQGVTRRRRTSVGVPDTVRPRSERTAGPNSGSAAGGAPSVSGEEPLPLPPLAPAPLPAPPPLPVVVCTGAQSPLTASFVSGDKMHITITHGFG